MVNLDKNRNFGQNNRKFTKITFFENLFRALNFHSRINFNQIFGIITYFRLRKKRKFWRYKNISTVIIFTHETIFYFENLEKLQN